MSLKDRVKEATGDTAPPPPTTDLATNDTALAWLRDRQTYFTDALPRHVDRAHFISVALSVLPKLERCSHASVHQALLACARYGLEPDGRMAAIVPYGQTATFQPMYEGYIELMYRSPRIDTVHFSWIRQRDEWDYTPTAPSPQDFFHKPRIELSDAERGPVILAYAFAWIEGRRSQVITLNKGQAAAIRDKYSKAYALAEKNGKKDSAWHTDFDAMWAKSCVRRLVKVVPTSTELADLIRADDDGADAGMSAPSVIRGHVVTRDEQAPDGSDRGQAGEPEDGWPQAAQPGSGARKPGPDTGAKAAP